LPGNVSGWFTPDNPVSILCARNLKLLCNRYMDAYREKNGQFLTVQEVEHAVRKFKSHRSIPPWMNKDD
jgi:hypothetical protein